MRGRGLVVSMALAGGCAFVPADNLRLDEANEQYEALLQERIVETLAPQELQRAVEALARAAHARATLDDPAAIDHLAYLASQQLAIAREAARMRGYDWDPIPPR